MALKHDFALPILHHYPLASLDKVAPIHCRYVTVQWHFNQLTQFSFQITGCIHRDYLTDC